MKNRYTPEQMAAQRANVARLIATHDSKSLAFPFAQIGLLWHSKRRASLGIRFAPTAELVGQTFDDGSRWQPLEAHRVTKGAVS